MSRSCGTQPRPACARRWLGTTPRFCPSKRIVPRDWRVAPISVASKVDLPMPLRPSSARLPPAARLNEMSSSTVALP